MHPSKRTQGITLTCFEPLKNKCLNSDRCTDGTAGLEPPYRSRAHEALLKLQPKFKTYIV
jgi:hypothetical protein